ncbi:MAG TPA: maleylpyruvate isomerase family mycothiol-dependent enzyme [Marmoricola sp.]|jgi:uncharacterized protein (TIGR03086 family)|nr:maleylpyruvate isomerase family mycothiol-dependent enzyme [Marmoricola sp.]
MALEMTETNAMPATAVDERLGEALGMLERAVGYTRLALQHITPEMLCLPTPCSRWRLAALLDHMGESLEALTEAADLGQVAPAAPPGPPSPVDAVERLRVGACSLLGSWSAVAHDDAMTVGDRPTTSSSLARAGALEIAVHGWDVSQATGIREPIPAALARDLLPWVGDLVGDFDRPDRFDYPLDGPAIGPSSRLLRDLGREP